MPEITFRQWRPHPWHGLEIGPEPPRRVHAYIEITPFDVVKYEVDKLTGYLRVDRPQRTSSAPPSLYGFIPRTYCGPRVGALAPGAGGQSPRGDGDPLDVCVLSERPIDRAEVILNAIVVGGIQTTDHGEADDKIIAVLEKDSFWGNVNSLHELPEALIARLRHYFSTYKLTPGEPNQVVVHKVYDAPEAWNVVEAASADYQEAFGHLNPE